MTEPATPQDTTEPTASTPNMVPVTLDEGFRRNGKAVTSLTLRRPSAGELRGLSLQDLMRADVGAVITLLPRISDPIMIQQEAERLAPMDLAECAGVIAGFFLNQSQRAQLANMMSTSS